jgi:hypothetical protein
MSHTPNVTVLTAPDESALPGLEDLGARARVRYARDEAALREALPDTDILLVTDFRTDMLRKVWPAEHRIRPSRAHSGRRPLPARRR